MKSRDKNIKDCGRGTDGVRITMRIYFSTYHLWAANHFGELARIIETQHTGCPHFDIKHRAYVMGAIFSSVAFLEAAINEYVQDVIDGHASYVSPPAADAMKQLKDLWNKTEGKNGSGLSITEKYRLALEIQGLEALPSGHAPLQDVVLLIRLRNALTHYKLETIAKDIKHKFETQLSNKFPENRLMANSNNPYFPDRCLGFGCAEWSNKSSRSFTDTFFSRVNAKPNYQVTKF